MTDRTPLDDGQFDWHHWLERWDAQQSGYLPQREERFAPMRNRAQTAP